MILPNFFKDDFQFSWSNIGRVSYLDNAIFRPFKMKLLYCDCIKIAEATIKNVKYLKNEYYDRNYDAIQPSRWADH